MSEQPLLQEMPKQYNRYEPDDIVAGRSIRNGIFYSLRGSYIYQILPDQTYIINAVTGSTIHKIRYNQNAHALSAIYRPSYNYLLIGLSNNTLVEIDCDNFKLGLTYYLQGKPISLSLSDDQSVLGIGQSNGHVQLLDLIDQQIIQMDIAKQNSSIIYLNLFPNNLMVTISAERNMHVYENYKQKQLITEIPGINPSHIVYVNLYKNQRSKKYEQTIQNYEIQEQYFSTIMLLADENIISIWMQNTTQHIDFNVFFQDGTLLKDQLREMLALMGLQEFPSVQSQHNTLIQDKTDSNVHDINTSFTSFAQVGRHPLEKARGKLQALSMHSDILLAVFTSGIEVFRIQDDVLRTRANRVKRTVKQRLERIQAQINKQATSPGFTQEKAQLFAPVEFLSFRDIFTSVGFVSSRPEQRFVGQSIHYYETLAKKDNSSILGKLMIEFMDERHQFTLQLVSTENALNNDESDADELLQQQKQSKKSNKQKQTFQLVPLTVAQHSHPTIPSCVSLNGEDTLIVTADGWRQMFFTIRKCSLIACIDLPENFGRPLVQFVLPGGTYTVLISKDGLAVVTNVARQEVESMIQVLSGETADIVAGAQLYNDILIVFSKKGHVTEYSFQMQSDILQLVQERAWDSQYEISTVLLTPQYSFFALTDGSVRIHHRDTFKFKMTLYGHALAVTQLLISPTGEKLFTLSQGDKTLRSWGLTFGECLRIIKLQDHPMCFTLIAGTNNVIVGVGSGKLLQYDLDTYQQVAVLSTGNFGQIVDPGHSGAVTALCSSKNGKLVLSCGTDGCKTWIQGDDVFTVESEKIQQEEMQQATEAVATGGRGQKWGETLHGAHLSALDLLQETIDRCYDKFISGTMKSSQEVDSADEQGQTCQEASKNAINSSDNILQRLYALQEQQKQVSWQEELHTVLFSKTSRAVLPELFRALPSASADRLLALLLARLQASTGSQDELLAWALIRLARTVFPGRLGQNAEIAAQTTQNVFSQLLLKNSACLGLIRGFTEQ